MDRNTERGTGWMERLVTWLGLPVDYDLTIPETLDLRHQDNTSAPPPPSERPQTDERHERLSAFEVFKFAPPH